MISLQDFYGEFRVHKTWRDSDEELAGGDVINLPKLDSKALYGVFNLSTISAKHSEGIDLVLVIFDVKVIDFLGQKD